jgi:hypothetical protein
MFGFYPPIVTIRQFCNVEMVGQYPAYGVFREKPVPLISSGPVASRIQRLGYLTVTFPLCRKLKGHLGHL